MDIKINSLTEADKGKWVYYIGYGGEREHGRIKSWNKKWIFVVYHCAGEWDRYKDYTGTATNPSQLIFDQALKGR